MLTDPQIRDIALKRFTIEAPAKFTKGMQEHNPDGTKGLMRMEPLQLVDSIAEEVIDQWHYIESIRQKFYDLLSENRQLRSRIISLEEKLKDNKTHE